MEAVMREVLTVLVAAREPLPIDQIQLRCLHADEAQVRSAVRALGVLLVMEPETKTVSFCHWSVREFFVHGRAGPFRVAVQGEAVADDLSEASAPPYSLEDVTPAAPPVTFSNPYKWTTLVDNNWTCQLHAQNHPFFISYRREADRDAAVALKPMLQLALDAGRQGAPPPVGSRHPFFDDDCISFVGEWVPKWISAVFHAKVFVLLFSERTLQRMQNADKRSDGVLLEWEIALILQQEGRSAILPLFLAAPGSSATHSAATSSSSSTSVSNNPIFAIDLDRFPDSPHADPLSPGQRSVRGTVAKILFDSRATVVDPRNSADMNRAVTAASELLKQLESA
ncbi:hypothetical protein DFJ73DRAFT_862199 [Zopfochytrium polystomum]|nr:hypothetical protein DFJ73DRAFT_862199 [Zopfochytrium polystomum]